MELSHYQLPVGDDAHGPGPERGRMSDRLSSSHVAVMTRMERQASGENMNIFVLLTKPKSATSSLNIYTFLATYQYLLESASRSSLL